MSEDQKVQTLKRLGLTSVQARVYLALVQSGILIARQISRISKVARQDIYRVLWALEKLGLVEKVITKPFSFKAIPIQECVSTLMERRIKEMSELRSKSRELIKCVTENQRKTIFPEKETQFILIPKEAMVHERRKSIETSQNSIDIITTCKRFVQSIFKYGADYRRALKRGVKIRYIVGKPEGESQLIGVIETLKFVKKYPLFKVKYFRDPIPTVLALVDKKKLFIFIVPTQELEESDALFSTNPSLIKLSEHCFEMMWLTGLEDKNLR